MSTPAKVIDGLIAAIRSGSTAERLEACRAAEEWLADEVDEWDRPTRAECEAATREWERSVSETVALYRQQSDLWSRLTAGAAIAFSGSFLATAAVHDFLGEMFALSYTDREAEAAAVERLRRAICPVAAGDTE